MDKTENTRRKLVKEINAIPSSREALEKEHGKVWNTEELSQEFRVIGFSAPFVVVQRKSDSVKGSVAFQHLPRFYFDLKV